MGLRAKDLKSITQTPLTRVGADALSINNIMDHIRKESDSMGEMSVPKSVLYGASTQRAVLNFPISGQTSDPELIRAFGLIKMAAAEANGSLGVISKEKEALIKVAAEEIYLGKHYEHFPVDVYQTGSGTSTNMNVNEVIANRCAQIAGLELDSAKDLKPVHPNDDVNQSQSSNDTFPTAMHIAVVTQIKKQLLPELHLLQKALHNKASEFSGVLKIGRTHLMDATPITLGQEFGGFARQIELAVQRMENTLEHLLELSLGGTAVGTGINCHEEFPGLAISFISEKTGIQFREASNHFESQSSKDALVECHGQLNTINTSLFKIANDIRLLGSGPRCNLGEIKLPPTQPGSSIMPGKVNPVMSEAVTMIAARVFGNQTTVTWAGANGHLQLNAFMPVMIQCIMESINLTTKGCRAFREKSVEGITANSERCNSFIDQSLAMATSLAPVLGYDLATQIAKESLEINKTVFQVCISRLAEIQAIDANMDEAKLKHILDPIGMIGTSARSKSD